MNSQNAVYAASALLSVALLFVGVACGPSSERGSFELADIRAHEACFQEAFPLEATFATARERIDSVGIFLQDSAGIERRADLVYFEIYDLEGVRQATDPVAFDHPATVESPIRGEVALRETCPRLNEAFALRGELRFEDLKTGKGDRVRGELVEGTVINARTGEIVVESITGSWDFTVKLGSPWQFFTNDREEYPVEP